MTVRDRFAAAALTGLASQNDLTSETTACLAFELAGAMVAERMRGILKRFCREEWLPEGNADDLLMLDLTPEQRNWLEDFVGEWEINND
jgi:hypothetical protein